MAIKFGDILQNQNAAYPIVEASNNDVKGLIFSTGLPEETDFPNKRALGTILVDTNDEKMYFFTGNTIDNATWGSSANWELLATGSGETIQTTDLPVNIPAGRSFGRFVNGDTIDVGDGETAMQIIIDAITSFVTPVAAFTGSEGNIQFDTTSQNTTHTVSFTVTNSNQAIVNGNNFAIQTVRLFRRNVGGSYGSTPIASANSTGSSFTSGTFADLNTTGTPTAVTFTLNDSFTHDSGDNDVQYKIEIVPLDGSGGVTTTVSVQGEDSDNSSGFINSAGYNGPQLQQVSVERQDVSTHFKTTGTGHNGQETDIRRPKGNIASKITFTLDNDSELVPITGYSLQRSIDGQSYEEIFSETGLSIVGTTNGQRKIFDSIATSQNNITGLNGVVTGFTDVDTPFPPGSINADTIQYQVVITDEHQDTTIALGSEINLEFPGMIGFGTTDGSEFDSDDNAQMTNLLQAIRDNSSLQAQYEIISIADNQAVDPDFGVVPINSASNQFVYIGFPAALNEIDTVLDPNNANSYTAFGSDPKSTTVTFTTHYGVQGTYEFYCSNGVGSFTGNHTIN